MDSQASKHPEQQYLDLMRELLAHGDRQVDAGHGKATQGLFGKQMRFDLSTGFPLLTTKRVYWKGVLHELYWFMSGQTNIKYLVDNSVHIWDDYPYKIYNEKVKAGREPELTKDAFVEKIASDEAFAKAHGELPHIYGEMWRRWQAKDGRTVDQLQWTIDELSKDPGAHNTLVTSWNPEYLYSMAKPGEGARFPICHNMFQFNIKHGKLSLHLYQRSADIFLGVPFNIASYALLCVIVARILKLEPGEFIHTFGDVHFYEDHEEAIKEQLTREPKALPTIRLSDAFDSLDTFKPEHVELIGYEPHASIKAELTVAGGYNEKLHGKIN